MKTLKVPGGGVMILQWITKTGQAKTRKETLAIIMQSLTLNRESGMIWRMDTRRISKFSRILSYVNINIQSNMLSATSICSQ